MSDKRSVETIKYKKIPNNDNAIILRKENITILSFDGRFKGYLKWKELNPQLELELVRELEEETHIKYLYNNGAYHEDDGVRRWYDEKGQLKMQAPVNQYGEYNGEVLRYYHTGVLQSREHYVDGKRDERTHFYPNGNKMVQDVYAVDSEDADGRKWGSKLNRTQNWTEEGQIVSDIEYDGVLCHGGYDIWYPSGIKRQHRTYKDGKMNGLWTEWYATGVKRAEGSMKGGFMDGIWKFWFQNGKKELECNFDAGTIVNDAKIYNDNGKLKMILDEDGKYLEMWNNGKVFKNFTYKKNNDGTSVRDGEYTEYDGSGNETVIGLYKDDMKVGKWFHYYEDGSYRLEATYKDNHLHGEVLGWHPNGNKWYSKLYDKGKEDGKWTYYFDNGKIQMIETFRNGKKNGRWSEWYIDGNERTQGNMKNNKMIGEWKFWYSNGKKKLECNLHSGTLIGPAKIYNDNGKLKTEIKND